MKSSRLSLCISRVHIFTPIDDSSDLSQMSKTQLLVILVIGMAVVLSFKLGGVFESKSSSTISNLPKTVQTPSPLSPNPQQPAQVMPKIAFSSCRGGIYTMNIDGSSQTRITNTTASDYGPSWSPDGNKIAFMSRRDGGNSGIYVMNADGSNQIRLTTNQDLNVAPSWSPDGNKIAFHSIRDDNVEIYVMNADGSNQTRITSAGYGMFPSWSPDGNKIAFSSKRNGNWQIYVMNTDGSNQTRISTNSSDYGPSWSLDSKKIAFTSNLGGNDEIYIMNADGSNQIRLTNNPTCDQNPVWSPR